MNINGQKIIKSTGLALLLVILFNAINLVIELFKIDEKYSIAFKHGYFILNESNVGADIFSNLFNFIVFTVFIYLFLNKK